MSTRVPLLAASFPSPTDEGPSLVQTLWAMKQNLEIAQGTRGTATASNLHGTSAQKTALAVAIARSNPKPV